MVPLKRVIAPAICSSNVAVASSRSRRSWSIRILRARTDAKPGGFGAGLVGPFDRAARPTIAASPSVLPRSREHDGGGQGFPWLGYLGEGMLNAARRPRRGVRTRLRAGERRIRTLGPL